MNKLGLVDFLQVLSVVVAIVAGALPSFIDVRKDGDLTSKGLSLIFIFIISALVAISATMSKSKEDSENRIEDLKLREEQYKGIIERATLTLSTSNRVLNNTNQSLFQLTNLQEISKRLNDSLALELLIQKETNENAKELLTKNTIMYDNGLRESALREANFKKRLALSCEGLARSFNFTFYNQGPLLDTLSKIDYMRREVESVIRILKSEYDNPILLNDSIKNSFWNEYLQKANDIDWMLNGYSQSSYLEIFNKMAEADSWFRGHLYQLDLGYGR